MQSDVTTAISCDALLDSGGGAKNLAAKPPRILSVLVACEYSGTVRDAFRALGHNAMSCDLLESEKPGDHYQGDVRDVLHGKWDLLIAHPPCTHLAVSGARWFKDKLTEQAEALDFVRILLSAQVPHIALENPISIISSRIRKPDQVIQPWQHGHGETKATCLWLNNLPKLTPSNIVDGREQRVWKMPPGPNRWKERSRTFPGIAYAMADQWSAFLTGAVAPPPLESKRSAIRDTLPRNKTMKTPTNVSAGECSPASPCSELARVLLMHAVSGIFDGCGNSYANAYTEQWLTHAKSLGAYHGRTIGVIRELEQEWEEWLDQNGGLPDWPDIIPNTTMSGIAGDSTPTQK